MPHSIHVGFLGVNEFTVELIDAITAKNVIAPHNLYISDSKAEKYPALADKGLKIVKDSAAMLIKSEIVVITADKKVFGTALAPVCATTRGKIIIAMSRGIDCDYVLERVAKGTLVVSAAPMQTEAGTWTAEMTYSKGFPEYLKAACIDIVGSICALAE